MDISFKETITVSTYFNTYKLAMEMLTKTVGIIREKGGDQRALSFILFGIQLLCKQLDDAAIELGNKEEAKKAVTDVLKDIQTKRDKEQKDIEDK